MRITSVDIGDEGATIYLSDDPNSGVADELALTISKLLNDGRLKITLNFEHVAVLDSAGLGEIVRASAAVRRHGGQVAISESPAGGACVKMTFKPVLRAS